MHITPLIALAIDISGTVISQVGLVLMKLSHLSSDE